jgi:hypothetical protein
MDLHTRKLVTVITEASLERDLIRDIDALGASGYTLSDARGRGHRGVRASTWEHSANLRVEVLCDAALAERLVAHLRERYYDNYAMVLFVQDVAVLRPGKFS